MEFILYALLVYAAALLQSWLGFGFPVIAMAFLPVTRSKNSELRRG